MTIDNTKIQIGTVCGVPFFNNADGTRELPSVYGIQEVSGKGFQCLEAYFEDWEDITTNGTDYPEFRTGLQVGCSTLILGGSSTVVKIWIPNFVKDSTGEWYYQDEDATTAETQTTNPQPSINGAWVVM